MIPTRLSSNRVWSFTKSTWATGSSGDPRCKNSARTYAQFSGNAGLTGTSPRPNSKRRGAKATRNSSTRTARHTPRASASRIRGSDRKSSGVP
jgi:hypothetical protein